jgi:hypothetical protein
MQTTPSISPQTSTGLNSTSSSPIVSNSTSPTSNVQSDSNTQIISPNIATSNTSGSPQLPTHSNVEKSKETESLTSKLTTVENQSNQNKEQILVTAS